ncbi:MAG TPA: TPM domain-containing protein [Bacteroidales bacterium]|nr:TPM domain-containing protein [Bacteroidales bacterium]
MKASDFFTKEEKAALVAAIEKAEKNTSGEIRVHIENKCPIDVLDRTVQVFTKLNMHKTQQRNGVLIYLAIEDKKFAIIGDAGINSVVPANFWDSVKEQMQAKFVEGKFSEGICIGIEAVGEKLKAFFPYQSDDVNELSDEISFGKG